MAHSKRLRTTCLAVAGIATAWAAAPTPVQAGTDYSVDITSSATMNSGASLTNPQFLYISNTTLPGTVPGTAALSASDFGPSANGPAYYNIVGYNDDDSLYIFAAYSSISYMIVGLAPNGDLVAGLTSDAATTAIASSSSFDSLFPPGGNEAAVIAALQSPGPAGTAALTAFADTLTIDNGGVLTENSNINFYTYYNAGNGEPGRDSLTLVDFGHDMGGNSVDTPFGTVALTLTTVGPVPEPATLALVGAPLLLMLGRRRRR